MSQLIYKKASLFDAPVGSLIVHAVNCQGVWGSGIAKEFRKRYPNSHHVYKMECHMYGEEMLGVGTLGWERPHNVGYLFTSIDYGKRVDPPKKILISTRSAVLYLLDMMEMYNLKKIYSNKFNSGLFRVPWKETEKVILECLEKYPEVEWVVMDLDS